MPPPGPARSSPGRPTSPFAERLAVDRGYRPGPTACPASTSAAGTGPRAGAHARWRVIFTTSSPTDRPANAASGLVAAVSRSARMTGWPGMAWMWPMLPATLTATGQRGRQRPGPGGPPVEVSNVESEFSDGQEHVDLGRPGRGLPAAEPVMDRPVIQPCVAVREGVHTRRDRDHPDRVQRGPPAPRVHRDLRACALAVRSGPSGVHCGPP